MGERTEVKRDFKVLNLYACLGGNRYKWTDCDVTAVELDPELARLYQERFPNDKVIIADAHQYLLEHYKEFDFIWSSPPCPSHSRIRHMNAKSPMYNRGALDVIYAEMSLYQEIILLENYFDGKYVVENVIPYYEPLIPAQKRGRHLYWTNFTLPNNLTNRKVLIRGSDDDMKNLCDFHEIDISTYKGEQRKDKIARNLVDYEAGLTIFNTARNIIIKSESNQITMFE
jgi:DNA (cytosine-5)-methyltransferase 1